MSLLITNGRIYVKGELIEKNILVEDGKIAKLTSSKPEADERVNVNGRIVLPGFIDPHVHFRDPGLTYKEDFRTGSFAAVAGGNTCVLDMPNTKPPTLTLELLNEKREIAKRKSVVNFGLHFGSSVDNLEEIKRVKNVPSVKIFMNASTGNMLIEDEESVREIMSSAPLCSVHAEGENVRKAKELAESLGKKFYLCHVSRAKELEYMKENGKNSVFVEVTPHHLFLTEKNQNELVRMKPALGDEKDRDSLWKALKEGMIDTIGSDHAPHTLEEKRTKEIYGVPGVETRVPLMLDAVNRGLVSLERIVETMCENPARIFGLKGKGSIYEGNDADLVIIDMKLRKKIRDDELFTKCGWSPFEGRKLQGFPIITIVNGNIVFEEGTIYEENKGEEIVCGING